MERKEERGKRKEFTFIFYLFSFTFLPHRVHPCTIGNSIPPLSNASPRTFF